MEYPKHRQSTIDTGEYYVLTPVPPFVDVALQFIPVNRPEFSKIVELTKAYRNDPRVIEMVRKSGDASAKVPYLIDAGETADSILDTLREIARPHVGHIQNLPDPVQATIHGLLSINTVPSGCEMYVIPALLEMDRIHGQMAGTLHELMNGRQLAKEFLSSCAYALQRLDRDWPFLREGKGPRWPNSPLPLPKTAQMQYEPFFDRTNRLTRLHEVCVIVDAPEARELQRFIPPVLQRPLPGNVSVPTLGSIDWLLHEVGKIGRHFTCALLDIVKDHLAAEQIAMEAGNYALINEHAQDALQEYVHKTP